MNLVNRLTILRIVMVPVFIGCLYYYSSERIYFYWIAVAVFLLACLTDAADGYIARKYNQKTELGGYIDPIADKILLTAGFLTLSFMAHLPEAMRIPAWVTISVITRDVIIVIGAVIVFISTGHLKPDPLWVGKVTTVFQMLTLLLSLLDASHALRYIFYVATVFLTVFSGVRYVRIGGELLNK